MSWIGWIVLGGLAGWVASIIMKTNKSQGMIADIAVGIIGAFLGGFVMNTLGGVGVTGFNIWSFFVAVVGAALLLAILGFFQKKKA